MPLPSTKKLCVLCNQLHDEKLNEPIWLPERLMDGPVHSVCLLMSVRVAYKVALMDVKAKLAKEKREAAEAAAKKKDGGGKEGG